MTKDPLGVSPPPEAPPGSTRTDAERNVQGNVPESMNAKDAAVSARSDIETFLTTVRQQGAAVEAGQRGRLIFALDATMSRQPTWDMACTLQSDMFTEAAKVGGLDVQLVYYRGFGECRASRFMADGAALAQLMTRIDCRGGRTQIGKVLGHARRQSEKLGIHALVFVGDAMEESIDDLTGAAGELALRGIPAFMFQEGNDALTEQTFREIARLTRGAYCRFRAGAADELRELLRAVAVYAAGGMRALRDLSGRGGSGAVKLLEQMK